MRRFPIMTGWSAMRFLLKVRAVRISLLVNMRLFCAFHLLWQLCLCYHAWRVEKNERRVNWFHSKISVCRFDAWQVTYNKKKEILTLVRWYLFFRERKDHPATFHKIKSSLIQCPDEEGVFPVFRGCIRGCNRWIVSKWWLRWTPANAAGTVAPAVTA